MNLNPAMMQQATVGSTLESHYLNREDSLARSATQKLEGILLTCYSCGLSAYRKARRW